MDATNREDGKVAGAPATGPIRPSLLSLPKCAARAVAKLLLALGVMVAPCHAQPAVAAAPISAVAQGGAIPAASILGRADDDEWLAEQAVLRSRESNLTTRLERELIEITRSVDESIAANRADDLHTLPVAGLESLDKHWQFDTRRLAHWQADMRRKALFYADLASQLARQKAQWEATRTVAASGNLPAALTGRVDTVLATITAAEDALSVPLEQLVELGRRGAAVGGRIEANRTAVNDAIEAADRRMLRLDAAPLWAMSPDTAGTEGALQSLEADVAIEGRFAQEYVRTNVNATHAVRLFQLLLLPLILYLAWRFRQAPASALHESEMRVLRRPFSAWLLLSVLAVLAFESDAPLLLREAAMLIALVPILRLLPRQNLRALDVWPYVAIGVYLADRLGFLLSQSSYVYRLFQFGLSSVALAITLWLLWRWRRQGLAVPPHAWLRSFGGLGAVLLGIAVVANLVGSARLAETLTSGIIACGYIALLMYASLTMSSALLAAALAQPALMRTRILVENSVAIKRMVLRVLGFVAALAWMVFTMDRFRILRPARAAIDAALRYDVNVGEISISLGDVMIFAVSVLVSLWAARLVRLLLRGQLLTSPSLPRGAGNSIASLSYYAIVILGFLVALSAAGFKISQLALVFSALGVGIGFGLQNVVSNFVSGLILMFERPVQPGDAIEVAGVAGRVRSIGMRATLIRTYDGADVVVPNSTLLTGNLTNWTMLDHSRRVDIEVGVGFESNPHQVLQLLIATARQTPGVASEPEPSAQMTGYGSSALNFVLRVWTHEFDQWSSLRSTLLGRVLQALREGGISIPYNQFDLNLRSVPDDLSAAVRMPAAGANRPG